MANLRPPPPAVPLPSDPGQAAAVDPDELPRLVALRGPFAGRTIAVPGDRFAIGRQDDNSLQIDLAEVSRHHCELRREGERVVLRDLGSRLGTRVNGRRARRRELAHGDLVEIGGCALLFLCRADPGSLAGEAGSGAIWTTVELEPAEARYLLPDPSGGEPARTARDLAALVALSRVLHATTDAGALAAGLLSHLLGAIPAGRACLLLDAGDGELRAAAAADRGGPTAPFARVEEAVQRAAGERLALLWEPGAGSLARPALVVAPLIRADQLLGVLYVESDEPGALGALDLELATAAGALAALAFDNARHVSWLRSENRRLADERLAGELLGDSAAMAGLRRLLARIAPTDATVLLRGESGTGKELAAQALHRLSERAEAPFVAVNCATFSETLLESELFGHERGAFTGAVAQRLGKLEAADRGTLFLDEVGEIPPALQARLLRVLQERTFERVGGNRAIRVDVRIVAATNRNLEAAMAEGRFREDLYYRLDVLTVRLPPLRDRRGDVELLSRHFARLVGRRLGREALGASPEALALLAAYAWPGNVRQLANVVERAVILGDDEWIRPEDLPEEIVDGARPPATPQLGGLQTSMVETKRRLVLDAWRRAGADYGRAADLLGVHVNSFHRLVRNLGLRGELS